MFPCVLCPYCRNREMQFLPLYFLPNVTCEIGINLRGYTSRSDSDYACEYWKRGNGVCLSRSTYDLICPTINEIGPHMANEDERRKQEMFDYVVASVYPQNEILPMRLCWTHMHMKWKSMFREMKINYKNYVKEYKRKKKNNDESPIVYSFPCITRNQSYQMNISSQIL